MLVNLLTQPPASAVDGVTTRRANPWEMTPVISFVREQFSAAWADEISAAFARQPVSVFIATAHGEVVGFCAHDCSRRNLVGPMGIGAAMRGRDVGKSLLLQTLAAMREYGYAYAIIGGVGPAEFYTKVCGATLISDSAPGIYTDLLK